MTPQEKAIKLVENYCHKISLFSSSEIHYIELAKQCAIIAVDEFLNIENIKPYILHKEIIKFYQEVKKEIELL